MWVATVVLLTYVSHRLAAVREAAAEEAAAAEAEAAEHQLVVTGEAAVGDFPVAGRQFGAIVDRVRGAIDRIRARVAARREAAAEVAAAAEAEAEAAVDEHH